MEGVAESAPIAGGTTLFVDELDGLVEDLMTLVARAGPREAPPSLREAVRLRLAAHAVPGPADAVTVSTVALAMVAGRGLPTGSRINWPAFERDARIALAAIRSSGATVPEFGDSVSKEITENPTWDGAAGVRKDTGASRELTVDFENVLPGGVADRCSYSDVEDALDRAEAPLVAEGRWLTLPQRIAALAETRDHGKDRG